MAGGVVHKIEAYILGDRRYEKTVNGLVEFGCVKTCTYNEHRGKCARAFAQAMRRRKLVKHLVRKMREGAVGIVENFEIGDTVIGDDAPYIRRVFAQGGAQAKRCTSRTGPDTERVGVDAQRLAVLAYIGDEIVHIFRNVVQLCWHL